MDIKKHPERNQDVIKHQLTLNDQNITRKAAKNKRRESEEIHKKKTRTKSAVM